MADDPERIGDLLVRVAELEAALGAAYRQLSNVATVHDPKHNFRWTNIALDTLRGVTKGDEAK